MELMKLNSKPSNQDQQIEDKKTLCEKKIAIRQKEFKSLCQESDYLNDEALLKHYLIERIQFSREKNSFALNSIAMEQNDTKKILNKPETFTFPWKCPPETCLRTNFDILDWKECEKCLHKYHSYCIAKTRSEIEEETRNIYTPEICLECEPRVIDMDIHQEDLDTIKAKAVELSVRISDEEGKIKAIEDELKYLQSREEIKFDKTIRDLGIDIQAFHSNSLVGNHCDRLIAGSEQLIELIHDEEKKIDYREYFECLENILKTMNAKRWLDDDEIENVELYCERFGVIYPKLFKNITVKICDVVFHLPAFLREFRTLGFLSEEDTESLHRQFNSIVRPLASIRNKPLKLLLGLKRLCLRKLAEYERPDFAAPVKRKFSKRNEVESNHEKLKRNRMM